VSSQDPKPPYSKYAFLNAYNLSVLGGAFTFAAATQNWWVAAVGAGIEGLWMLFAPDSRLLQKVWFDKYHQAAMDEKREAEMNAKFAALPPQELNRCRALRQMRDQILLLATDNPAFTQDLLKKELGKLDQLVLSFLELASTCTRYTQYLRSVDVNQIESESSRFARMIEANDEDAAEDKEKRALAQKNFAVLGKRRDKYAEIASSLSVSRGQLDLIENTFKLLADQIVTMRTSSELAGQLDELIDGVESIRQTARETEKFMTAVER
jgi:hypothetical protein